MKTSSYNQAGVPSGWTQAEASAAVNAAAVNACHLAPSVLGGNGGRANIAACWRFTNVGANSMRAFEARAAGQLKHGLVVEYIAMPIYRSSTSQIPTGFQLSYIAQSLVGGAGMTESTYVSNDANGALPNLGN
jgi:DNA/RNA non-specific endonuclease